MAEKKNCADEVAGTPLTYLQVPKVLFAVTLTRNVIISRPNCTYAYNISQNVAAAAVALIRRSHWVDILVFDYLYLILDTGLLSLYALPYEVTVYST